MSNEYMFNFIEMLYQLYEDNVKRQTDFVEIIDEKKMTIHIQ